MEDDSQDLSPELCEKVAHFQEVTGIEDIAEAQHMLEAHNWNVEEAIQNQLTLGDIHNETNEDVDEHIDYNQLNDDAGLIRRRFPLFPPSPHDGGNLRLFDPPLQPEIFPVRWFRKLFGWGFYLAGLPVNVIVRTFSVFFRFVYQFVFPTHRRITDPVGDVISFISSYETSYGREYPAFFQGSYSQALSQAKAQLKFLLVYLHCADHQETNRFCRTTLADATLREFVDTQLIFWGCSVTSAEGYRVSQAMRENGYPFLAVIVLKENRMMVVGRSEGPRSAPELLVWLQSVIVENEVFLMAAQADRRERESTQMLRQEQDVAYQESLRADQEKSRRRQEEREEKEALEDIRRKQEEEGEHVKEEMRKKKQELAAMIPPEPMEKCDDVVHIVLKLPEGTRIERRFLRCHSLKFLFYFILCHPEAPDRFQVTMNFPRQVIPCEPTQETPEPPTFDEFKLPSKSLLFVVDLDA